MSMNGRRPRQYKTETKYEMNLVKLMEHFHSEDKCRELMEGLRWPDGIRCPRCESKKISRHYARNQFVCDSCDYNFSVTSGTMLHDTRLLLQKWFLAVYMMVESKKGMSANQLKRSLDVSYTNSL
jgi:transposase-like protein